MLHAIDLARTQIGVFEETGNNDGIPAERYMRGDELAWCAGFVLWCYDKSDDPDIWDDYDASTRKDGDRYWGLRAVSTMMDWAHEMKVFIESSVIPSPNDVIFYDYGTNKHTGIVEKVDATSIHTIEGNYQNAVKRRVVLKSSSDVAGFARFARYTPKFLVDSISS